MSDTVNIETLHCAHCGAPAVAIATADGLPNCGCCGPAVQPTAEDIARATERGRSLQEYLRR